MSRTSELQSPTTLGTEMDTTGDCGKSGAWMVRVVGGVRGQSVVWQTPPAVAHLALTTAVLSSDRDWPGTAQLPVAETNARRVAPSTHWHLEVAAQRKDSSWLQVNAVEVPP